MGQSNHSSTLECVDVGGPLYKSPGTGRRDDESESPVRTRFLGHKVACVGAYPLGACDIQLPSTVTTQRNTA
eukprot:849570-Pyramimonas_sp.AAC.1